jgi:hypothetical protein
MTCCYPNFLVQTAWNTAAEKSNKEILEKLCVWGRKLRVKIRDVMLLPIGKKILTAWEIAHLNGNKEALQRLYCWGTEVQVYFKGYLLPAKD